MSEDHYFTAEPASPEQQRTMDVMLADRRVTVRTAGGIFSPERVDQGTAVLLREAPAPPEAGTFLDLGCGWGPIAITLALRSPAATVWAVDVNERALALAAANTTSLDLDVHVARPADVPDDVAFDLVWSNPPIRVGKDALHALLRTWLPRLAPGGTAYLVVSKNLGSDSLQRWLAEEFAGHVVGRFSSDKGFRVLSVVAPG